MRSGPLNTPAILGLLVAAGCSPSATPSTPSRPPIVLIVLDTLRTSHLGAYGSQRATSPRIDALAGHSLVFERASSTAPWTVPAIAALFTGESPGALGIRDQAVLLPESVPMLTEILRDEGYQTFGVVSHIYVGEKIGFARGFERWNEENALGHAHVSSKSVTDIALEMLAQRDRERPPFLFVHYFDAHFQYVEHAGHEFGAGSTGSGVESLGVNALREGVESGALSAADLQRITDVYDSEVNFVDHHVGRLLGELERQGLYDEALVVLTADHGEALGDHQWVGHARSLYEELVHVPLLVKLPGSRASRSVAASVSTRDLLPTLVDHLGLAAPGQRDAAERSLLRANEDRVVFAETFNHASLQSVALGPWKLVHDTESGREWLFDLSRDPGELVDRSAEEPARRAELDALRRAWILRGQSAEGSLGADELDLSAEELERLRQLGYGG